MKDLYTTCCICSLATFSIDKRTPCVIHSTQISKYKFLKIRELGPDVVSMNGPVHYLKPLHIKECA